MADIPPADPDKQLELWRQAVDALGGQRETGKLLGYNNRTINRLYAGAYQLHDGTLEETARALAAHAALCRELERQLSPAFIENLTERQRKHDMRGRVRPDREGKANG